MAVNSYDINAALIRKVKALSPESKTAFQQGFSKAPLMLAFLKFLEQQKEEKFRVQDAVLYLYEVKYTAPDYSTYENRFFKLRKKLYDHFHTSSADTQPVFTPQEVELHEIKNLTILGKYQEAYSLLTGLEEKLWSNNIFELLPEVIDLLIHNNQVQRKYDANEALYVKQELAIELLTELLTAKRIARQIYDVNLTRGVNNASALFNRLQRISINRKDYPRFKLIYNLISVTCKLAGGGLDFKPDFKITNRYIGVIHQLHAQYPQMPDYRYIAGYSETQTYMFANFEVMNNFNAFQFREAANLMKSLYEMVSAENSPLRRMKGDVFYSTSCLVLNLGGRHNDALKVANDYLKYLVEVKQNDKLLNAYMEIINSHIWLHPVKSGYADAFMFKKLDEFCRSVKDQPYSHYYLAMANWLKIKLLLVMGEYAKAKAIYQKTDFSSYFMDERLGAEVAATFDLMLTDFSTEKRTIEMARQLNKVKMHKLGTKLPPDYSNFMFLEKFLQQGVKPVTAEVELA